MSGDVITVGRELIASMRITTQYPPVLSKALSELEAARAALHRVACILTDHFNGGSDEDMALSAIASVIQDHDEPDV